jgi:acyl-CoA thioesterase-1
MKKTTYLGIAFYLCTLLGAVLLFATQPKTILVLGDSLTAGYGIDVDKAFPAVLQAKIEQESLPYVVVNAGVSGDTTAGGLRRIDWLLRQRINCLILALGANDGLRGVPLEATKSNLQGIINKTRQKYPEAQIIIAGMLVPPNMGPDYFERFRELFKELARENDALLIPFLLDGVAGKSSLNLADGIHPTPEGHEIMAENVWQVLEPVLERPE